MFDSNKLFAYEMQKEIDIPDISSKAYLLAHKKSGARVLLIENDDDNKVFSIGFRTPPSDSTGVPHIMEHSVLCGSKKYPVKDPFVELVKGSLNTFLNAMTFPDKTLYPVASCNDKDFSNLMDVYMDAVLNPNIYMREQIFKQEGWHYELFSEDEDITINGVVYNEMKGAFSSPEDMMDREIFNSLFPDTPYAKESGGDPDVIPELTYEQFLDFHRKYYHPSNSYIYLYGKMDFNEKLEYLDKEYLCKYDVDDTDTHISLQDPFNAPAYLEKEYGITEDDSEEDNTYLSLNYVIDTSLNKELYTAFSILEYALIAAPGAAVKQRLLDEGIGKDIFSNYENGIAQPYFSMIAKNANLEDKERFVAIIKEELQKAVDNGIDKKALLAGINTYEFRYREADFGSYPKGLMIGMQCMDSWLYSEEEPVLHISQNETFAKLRAALDTDYFEKLVEKYLINNMHSSIVVIKPKKGLVTQKEAMLAARLNEYKATLSSDEIKKLIEDTKALKKYQEEPSSQEELKSIPLLSIDDIKKEVEPFVNEEKEVGGVKTIFHEVDTNGIGYLNLLFDASFLEPEELKDYAMLTSLLSLVSTKNYHYSELSNEININSGGISPSMASYNNYINPDKFYYALSMSSKFLIDQTEFVFEMMDEILHNSCFDDKKRLYEIIAMVKSRMEMSLMHSGHVSAARHAMAGLSKYAFYSENTSGIAMYKYVKALEENFDSVADDFISRIRNILSRLLKKENLVLDYTGDKKGLNRLEKPLMKFCEGLDNGKEEPVEWNLPGDASKTAFKTSGQVQFVAVAGNFINKNLEYKGTLRVLHTILSSEYLWINVRVLGGAYGCMCSFPRTGDAYFTSYRDPHLKNTLKVYEDAVDYIKNIEIDERDMTKYIIGTISDLDVPLTPRAKGVRSLNAYMGGLTLEMAQKARDEVLNATVDDIRELYTYIEAVLEDKQLCVVGTEDKINNNTELFEKVDNLL